MTTDNEELWYVQMDSGELRELTLDELDEAFNAGLLHENTYVMEVGGTEWQTLADVAGLNEEEPPAPQAPAYAPQALGPARPLPQLTPQGGSQWPPATSAAMGASAWPPVVAAAPAYAPRPAPAAHVPYNIGPQSTAPVVHDLSDLDLNPPFKRRSMGKWVAAVAVLVLGGAGFAATQMKSLPRFAFTAPKAPVEVTAAMTAPRAPEPTPAATTAPTPPPATTTASDEKKEEKAEDDKDSAKSGTRSLSEEMKAKLMEADKTRAKDRKSKRAARAATASKRSGRGKKGDGGGPFRGGGSASDPLNSKL